MSRTVIVIGGGAIGLSAAFRLAGDGARVHLLERKRLGSGASGRTAALLEFQTDADRDPHLFELARLSRADFPALEEDVRALTGDGFGLETAGILVLAATERDATSLRARVAAYRADGLRADWLTGEAVARAHPALSPAPLGGAWFGEDGQVSADRFLAALSAAARAAGVDILEDAGDVTLERTGDAVVARSPSLGDIAGDTFVVAAGAWSAQALRPLGVDLPVHPVRGQLALYDATVPDLSIPVCAGAGAYLAPKHTHLVVGATVENVGYDCAPTDAGRAALAGIAGRLLAGGASLRLREVVAGLRPATPDLLPLIGFLPGHPAVMIAGGHYRNGILLAPITARLVADLVAGRRPPLDLAPFRPDRFLVPQAR